MRVKGLGSIVLLLIECTASKSSFASPFSPFLPVSQTVSRDGCMNLPGKDVLRAFRFASWRFFSGTVPWPHKPIRTVQSTIWTFRCQPNDHWPRGPLPSKGSLSWQPNEKPRPSLTASCYLSVLTDNSSSQRAHGLLLPPAKKIQNSGLIKESWVKTRKYR